MTDKTHRIRSGSSLEGFLKEQGIYEEAKEYAIKSVIAFQLGQIMEAQSITKAELARRLETSRAQVDRLLDPQNEGTTVRALSAAAKAVGRELKMELV